MLYLDSADRVEIARLGRSGLFAGVTTNPKILGDAGMDVATLPQLARDLRGLGVGTIFFQTSGTTHEEMLASARLIQDIDREIIVKVPAVPEGYQIADELRAEGTSVLVTMVYHPVQALLAQSVDAWGIAPYFGRMSDLGIDYGHAAEQMVKILCGSETRILAASVRSVDMVTELAAIGVQDFTLGTKVADQLLNNRYSAEALIEFERLGKRHHD